MGVRYVRLPVEGGIPVDETWDNLLDNDFKEFVGRIFNHNATVVQKNIGEIYLENDDYYALYNSTAKSNEEQKIILQGKSIYSDVYIIKKDEEGNYIGLDDQDIKKLAKYWR